MIRGCTINTAADGIVSKGGGVEGALIIDNTITGPTVWYEGASGVDGDNLGEGILLTGPGNVVAFNRLSGFRDCISLLEGSFALDQTSIDIYGNDLSECADDGIEADFSMGNVRVHHNRLTNAFMGISSQPNLGGPSYFVRNVLYNVVHSAFKLQRSSVGDVAYHNTVVKAGDAFGIYTTDVWSRASFRNNLFIGAAGADNNGYDAGPGRVLFLPTADDTCDFDYDGFGSIDTGIFQGNVGGVTFDGLAELQTLTTEAHAVEVELSIFQEAVTIPDPVSLEAPVSFALAATGAALDAGMALPGINDDAFGAPDLGAYELDQELPVYGPGGTLGSGGSAGAGGAGSGGGDPGAGGAGAGDAASTAAAGGSGASPPPPGDDSGCSCRTRGGGARYGALAWPLFGGLFLALRIRRRRRG